MDNFHRLHSTDLDQVLGTSFKVLDDGFIRVIDYMGTDEAIVQAARVSYGKGTKKMNEDRGLIRYLIRNYHTTPFEMCEIKLHLRLPMDCWRQWVRHRTANINEYSTRYSIAIDAAQQTSANEWRMQSKTNKQGSNTFIDEEAGKVLSSRENDLHLLAREVYQERIEMGVAREQARKDLTLSTYTEAYWKVDLHNLLHFLMLRMDLHAQHEIRQYANIIGNEIVSKWCPMTWEAFLNYRLNSINLSRTEISLFSLFNTGKIKELVAEMQKLSWIDKDQNFINNRERVEFESKLSRLGIYNFLDIIKGKT